MKKEVYVAIFLVTFSVAYIFLMSTLERPVYLSEPECEGVEGQVILRLSSGTNAHAEIASGTNYIENICYNEIFGKKYAASNPTICDGKNLVLKLSEQTNAHAEIVSGTNYNVNVCYGNIQECELVRTGGCPAGKRAIVRLSSDTNAHLEEPGLNNYNNVICCKISPPPGPVSAKQCNNGKDDDGDNLIDYPNDPGCEDINDDNERDSIPPPVKGKAYWADENGVEFKEGKSKANVNDAVTLVAIGIPANAEVNFVIWDEDLGNLFINPDDKIKDGIKAKADDKGVAKSSWKITKGDYDSGAGDEVDSVLELYFIANAGSEDLKSETLFLNSVPIPRPEEIGCSKYNDASYVDSLKNRPSQNTACDDDLGDQLKKDPLYSVSKCGEEIIVQGRKTKVTCSCKWEDNKCNFKSARKIEFVPGPGGEICKAICDPIKYEETQCVDNEKTISSKNKLIFENAKNCDENEKSSAQKDCPEEETHVVACGSKRLQLPLFGFAQFMISLIMISIFYALIIWRKRVRKKI